MSDTHEDPTMRLVNGTGTAPAKYSARTFFKAWRQVLSLAQHCRKEPRWKARNGLRHQMALHAREAERKMCSSVDPHELLRLRLSYCLTEPQQRILATVALAPATGFTGEFLCWIAQLGHVETEGEPAADVLSSLVQRHLVAVARGESQARMWKIRYVPGPALHDCVRTALDAGRPREDRPREDGSPEVVFLDDFSRRPAEPAPPRDDIVFLDDPEN